MESQTVVTAKNAVRSGALDAVRVFGIVAVIVGHAWDTETLRVIIYTWHVPVFFVLSGYLWSTNKTLRQEATKRTHSLLVPYAFWLVLTSMLMMAKMYSDQELSRDRLVGLLLGGSYIGGPFAAFWFVTALFVAVIVFRAMQKMPASMRLAIVFVFLYLAYSFGPEIARIPLAAGVALPCVIFLMAGQFLRSFRARLARPALLAAFFLIAAILMIFAGSSPLDLKGGDFGTPVVSVLTAILISFALILLSEVMLRHVNANMNNFFTRLASVGMMVIMTHATILWISNFIGLSPFVAFTCSLAFSWCASLFVSKTALSPWLVGAPKYVKPL